MDLKKELTREGVRGGQEQFKWDSLKSMSSKQREHYLGYTTKVGYNGQLGTFNKNDWWRTKKSEPSQKSSIEDEKQAAKALERDLMHEALGLKPQKLILAKNQLSADQMNSILKKEEEASGSTGAHAEDRRGSNEVLDKRHTSSGSGIGSARGLGYQSYGTSNPIKIFDEEDCDILDGPSFVNSEVKVKRNRSRSRSRTRQIK